jgi:hypothetical protein
MKDEMSEFLLSVDDARLGLGGGHQSEHEASRQDTSPLTWLWFWPWSSIRDAQ